MENCIFCKIIDKKEGDDFVFEDNEIVVVKDINPKAPVHLLVMPRKHINSIKDLGEEDKNVLLKMIYGAKDIAQGHNLEGYKLMFNVGREGGQVIDHLHLHLLGGWEKDSDGRKFSV